MGITLSYTVKCPKCSYTETWQLHTPSGPGEGQDPDNLPARKREWAKVLESEHPHHPK